MKKCLKYLFLIVLFAFISCGKSSTTQDALSTITLLPPDTTTTSYYNTATFTSHLNNANVVDAWNYIRYNVTASAPGEGIKILVADSATTLDHNAFQNRISQIYILNPYETGSTNYTELTTRNGIANARAMNAGNLTTLTSVASHGTAVTSIIAGNSANVSGSTFSGVAWGSTLGFLQLEQKRADQARNLDGYNTLVSNSNTLSNIIAANGYKIVNMSLGGYTTNSSETNSMNNAINNNVLLAIATGNNDTPPNATSYQNPQYPAAFAGTLNTTAKTGIILAVTGSATTTNDANATFNFCGSAKAYCLAAQNTNVQFASSSGTNSYSSGNGTSFATPLVSGAAAVIAGAYPTLSMKQVGLFLLRGADPKYATWETIATGDRRQSGGGYVTSTSLRANAKDGLVSDVYGYGTLNLLESAKLIQSTKVTASYTLAQSSVQTSSVVGDSIAKAINTSTINTHDDYGTYTLNIGKNITNISSLGTSDKVSASIRNSMANNFASTNIGNLGYMAFSSIIPQEGSSMTNGKFMSFMNKNGIFGENSSQLNNMVFGFSKHFAGANFSFQEGYNAQNFNLVYNLQTFNPFLENSFSGFSTKRFSMQKSFGSWNFAIATMLGNGATLQTINNITPEQSRNFASTTSLEYAKGSNIIGIETGVLRESTTLLGTYSAGALSLGQNNTTMFVKTKGLAKISNRLALFGSVAFGQTQTGQRTDSLFANVSQIVSRSFLTGVRFEKFYGGNLEFTYTQPLASISGNATLLTSGGNVLISLSPTTQEQDFGISFTKQHKTTSVSLQGAYILNRNNIAVPPTLGAFVSFKKQL